MNIRDLFMQNFATPSPSKNFLWTPMTVLRFGTRTNFIDFKVKFPIEQKKCTKA